MWIVQSTIPLRRRPSLATAKRRIAADGAAIQRGATHHRYPFIVERILFGQNLRGTVLRQRRIGVQLLLRPGSLQRRYLLHATVARRVAIIRCGIDAGIQKAIVHASRTGYIVHADAAAAATIPFIFDDNRIRIVECQSRAGAPFRRQNGIAVMQIRRRILFVLFARLRVVLLFSILPSILYAQHTRGRNHRNQRHEHRRYDDDHNLYAAQSLTAATVCLVMCRRYQRCVIIVRVRFVLAFHAAETARTHTLETVHPIHARAAVFARPRNAFVNVNAAILAGKARSTNAPVIVVQIDARTAIGTGFRQTEIHFARTIRTDVARHALATKLIHHIDTGAAVQTRISLAIVNVLFATLTGKA